MTFTTPNLPPKLVQANIALFKGERAETLRLIEEFRQQHTARIGEEHQVALLWLEAQAQGDHTDRLRLLRELTAVPVPSVYHRLAQELLGDEDAYQASITKADAARQRATRLALVFAGLAGVLFMILLGSGILFAPPSEPISSAVAVTETPAATPTTTPLPDQSRPLAAESFTKRYLGGILQIAAFEAPSARVISAENGDPLSPVTGAQFIALKLNFECRTGICNAPPEATLAVQLDSGDLITARQDAQIMGQQPFQPIALGHTTTGWMVFEIPLVGIVRALVITPAQDQTIQELIPLSLSD